MWVNPIGTMSKLVESTLGHATGGHESALYFNGHIYSDGQIGPNEFFYLVNYLWRSTPVILLGLLSTLVFFVARKGWFANGENRKTVIYLLIFVAVFGFFMNLGAQKFDRYILPVFLPLDLIAALGWVTLINWGFNKIPGIANQTKFIAYGQIIVGLLLLAWQATFILSTYPYYLTYYNPWMGGSGKAPEVMQIGWGEGLDLAADYLNQKPDAENLNVISWYGPWSFGYFFKGNAILISLLTDIPDETLQYYLANDYAVIYIHQWQRRIPIKLLDYLSQKTPEKVIWLDGLEYVRIYNLHE